MEAHGHVSGEEDLLEMGSFWVRFLLSLLFTITYEDMVLYLFLVLITLSGPLARWPGACPPRIFLM
jgi:hypothetical protein